MNDPTVKAAQDLVIELCRLRLVRIFTDQMTAFREGREQKCIAVYPPTNEDLNVVMAALSAARDAGLGEAWRIADAAANGARKGTKENLGDEIASSIKASKSATFALAGDSK